MTVATALRIAVPVTVGATAAITYHVLPEPKGTGEKLTAGAAYGSALGAALLGIGLSLAGRSGGTQQAASIGVALLSGAVLGTSVKLGVARIQEG